MMSILSWEESLHQWLVLRARLGKGSVSSSLLMFQIKMVNVRSVSSLRPRCRGFVPLRLTLLKPSVFVSLTHCRRKKRSRQRMELFLTKKSTAAMKCGRYLGGHRIQKYCRSPTQITPNPSIHAQFTLTGP